MYYGGNAIVFINIIINNQHSPLSFTDQGKGTSLKHSATGTSNAGNQAHAVSFLEISCYSSSSIPVVVLPKLEIVVEMHNLNI